MSTFGQPPGGPPQGGYGQPPQGGGYGQPPQGGYGQPPQGGGFSPPPQGGGGGFGPGGGAGGPPGGGFPAPPSGGAPGGVSPQETVKLPGLIMMIYGILAALCSFLPIIGGILNFLSTEDAGQLVGALYYVLILGLCGVVAFAGNQMRNLKSYPLAFAAAVFCCLPFCTGGCCLLGLVPGIWAVVVLLKPEVKSAFT